MKKKSLVLKIAALCIASAGFMFAKSSMPNSCVEVYANHEIVDASKKLCRNIEIDIGDFLINYIHCMRNGFRINLNHFKHFFDLLYNDLRGFALLINNIDCLKELEEVYEFYKKSFNNLFKTFGEIDQPNWNIVPGKIKNELIKLDRVFEKNKEELLSEVIEKKQNGVKEKGSK